MSQGHIFLYFGIVSGSLGAVIARWNEGLFFDFKSFIAVVLMNLAIIFFGISLRTMELTYSAFIYYALDAVILVLAGVFLFKEDVNAMKLISIAIVMVGLIGLNYSSSNKGLVNKEKTEIKD